jgi:hypothetical protein
MGTGQMLLVLLGAMLFSTILITTYNGLADQAELMYNGLNLLQAQKLGNAYLQKVDSEISGGVMTYDEAYTLYHNSTSYITDTLRTINFRTNIRANYCNSAGDTTAAGGLTSYMRVDVRVLFQSETGRQLRAGTVDAPLSRVIADLSI